jgi:hypothetical protein
MPKARNLEQRPQPMRNMDQRSTSPVVAMAASRIPGKTQTRKYSEKKHDSAEAEEGGTTGGKRTVV